MKKLLALLLMAFLFSGCIQQRLPENSIEAFFCPEDNCAEKLAQKFGNARESIDVAVYSFTLDSISGALAEAKNRGVRVRVIIDSLQAANSFSEDEWLSGKGISVKLAGKGSASMHNKFAVIDNAIVATGSFNYSGNADERNDENLVFIHGRKIAARFAEEFEEIWRAS